MNTGVSVVRRVEAPVGDAWVKRVVVATLRAVKVHSVEEVGVVFVGDAEMTRLNAAWRGKPATTDVLSFGNDGVWVGDESPNLLGDLVISMPQVTRQAKAAAKPVRREIALMLVHGTLHLLGYDHVSPREEKAMFALQSRVLKRLGYA